MTAGVASLQEELERARRDGLDAVARAADLDELAAVETSVLGRKSTLARVRSSLGKLPEHERKEVGRIATDVQRALEDAIEQVRGGLQEREAAARWERERIDVTLPGDRSPRGGIHPLTKTLWEILDVLIGLGYRVADGPEIELSTYNFDAINTPPEHPSRALADTFYVAGSHEELCLRTQTSPVQIRVMETQSPPVYVAIPGRVYRRDATDATHLPFFSQMEGLAVDEGITMGDLKGTLEAFARSLFGASLEIRMRPHFFPFTEPSAEVDVECFKCRGAGCRLCKGEGWIEILGAGMVHPFLLEWVGYDTERYSGFAFGIGIERVAALAHGVSDIRHFYENDVRFLRQFGGDR